MLLEHSKQPRQTRTGSVFERLFNGPRSFFFFFFVLYLITWGGHYTSGDGAEKVAWTKAMLFRQSADIDPGPGVAYSKYGVGHSLLALPLIAAAAAVKELTGVRCEGALYTLLFILNGAFFLYLAGRYLLENYSARQVWATLLILGLCTSWWPYTKMDFSESLILTFLFWGFLIIRGGHPAMGMLIASVALIIRPDAVVQIGILGLWCLWASGTNWRRQVLMLALAILPAIAANSWSNYLRWGSLIRSGYADETFSNPLLIGLYGMLFSAGKSVFLFSPPLILAVMALGRFLRTSHGRRDGWFFLAVFVSQLLVYAKWWDWSGDDSWGTRFLLPGVMLLCIPVVELLQWRRVVVCVAAAGVCVQLLAVLINGLDFVVLVHNQKLFRQAVYVDAARNRIDIEDMRFNPRYSQISGHWLMVRMLAGFPPKPGDVREEAKTGTPLYDALVASGWPGNARWDFIWLPR